MILIKKRLADDIVPGSNLHCSDKYKMRLYEAFFYEDFRDAFMRRNDSLSRVQLDARNSEKERVKPFFEIVCDKYNEKDWTPLSKPFPLFHHELIQSFDLPLLEGQELTYKQTKRLLVEVRGRHNIVSLLIDLLF